MSTPERPGALQEARDRCAKLEAELTSVKSHLSQFRERARVHAMSAGANSIEQLSDLPDDKAVLAWTVILNDLNVTLQHLIGPMRRPDNPRSAPSIDKEAPGDE